MTKRVALLWYGEVSDDNPVIGGRDRLRPLYDALVNRGVQVNSIPYTHERHETVAEQLRIYDGMMVWMNPIEAGQSRARLDDLLAELVSDGVTVSARPDIIQMMGTKAVIYKTREMEWGTESYLYDDYDDFLEIFPARLANLGTRVLKQGRGSSGDGVWKIEFASADATSLDSDVHVMNAGDDATVTTPLATLMADWKSDFSDGGYLVEQPFLSRVSEGMIRCYMNANRVIGILHQLPKSGGMNVSRSGLFVKDGLPEGMAVHNPNSSQYTTLKTKLETEWIDTMCQMLDMDVQSLPVLWDIDFIMGDKTESGEDTYLLCEINVSSVSPPSIAPFDQLAETLIQRL